MSSPSSQALDAVRRGGVVLYPTRTLWGIGGDARKPGVVARTRALKGRAQHAPFLLLVANVDVVAALSASIPPAAHRLIDAFWPGDLTLLLPASQAVEPSLVGPEGLVGVRVAQHPVPRSIIEATGAWLVSTSANPTGQPAALRLSDVVAEIRAGVDAVAEGPPDPVGTPSTIVAFDTPAGRLIREGAIPIGQIEAVLQTRLEQR